MTEELPYILHPDECPDNARLLLFQGRDLLMRDDCYLWSVEELHGNGIRDCHFLPIEHGGAPRAAVALDGAQGESLPARPVSTRSVLLEQGFASFRLIGRASQLNHWYRRHRFCGGCGEPTRPRHHQRVLGCPQCQIDYYPRISPCIIVLVTRGDRVLLARSAHRHTGYYSCLAGFLEVGESAEEAVAREVYEETGIGIDAIRYVESQSWPFPSQLMLGFLADYRSGTIRPDPEELAEADWFDLRSLPATPSARISVAGRLIEHYRRLRAAGP